MSLLFRPKTMLTLPQSVHGSAGAELGNGNVMFQSMCKVALSAKQDLEQMLHLS